MDHVLQITHRRGWHQSIRKSARKHVRNVTILDIKWSFMWSRLRFRIGISLCLKQVKCRVHYGKLLHLHKRRCFRGVAKNDLMWLRIFYHNTTEGSVSVHISNLGWLLSQRKQVENFSFCVAHATSIATLQRFLLHCSICVADRL